MLSVIIVDYKSIEKTVNYINHLKNRIDCFEDVHFIIVDNADSNEEKISRLFFDTLGTECTRELYDNYTVLICSNISLLYVKTGKNLGYAKANNLGAIIAKKYYNDDYILVSNNDLVLTETLDFTKIIEIFERDKKIAVIGPKIIGIDGKAQSPHKKVSAYVYLINPYWHIMSCKTVKSKDDLDFNDSSKYCYRVMGCFMFIRTQSFFEVGMFDENTFLYAEEMILSERLQKKGYKTFFYNDFTVIHEHGVTVKNNSTVNQALKWNFESIYYYFKHYRNTNKFLLLFCKMDFYLYYTLYTIKKRIVKRKKTERN